MLPLLGSKNIFSGKTKCFFFTNFGLLKCFPWMLVVFLVNKKELSHGKLVVWGPVVWDSRGAPK